MESAIPEFFGVGATAPGFLCGGATSLRLACGGSQLLVPVFDSMRHSSLKETSAVEFKL